LIHINRTSVTTPPSLALKGGPERLKAEELFGDPANSQRKFTFKAYKERDVVAALEQLFRGKCAYCESSYAPVAPADIEHFRPKGAVAIEDATGKVTRCKPGYYWLAADWDNLLPSCIDCNRARTHRFPGDDMTESRGKENQFPLMSETKRVRRHDQELASESRARLLLHPCRDQPERHLEFHGTGAITARAGSRKGAASIRVYALGRDELIEARRKHLLQAARKMRDGHREIERLAGDPEDEETARRVKELDDELQELARDEAEYAGMARQFIAEFEQARRDRTLNAFVHRLLTEVTTP
jgi:uncharacterized protein (TIGR02646 family)